MRFVVCARIWHGFDVLHYHLLLMMGFDYPLAFRHKKGEYIFDLREHVVLFSGGEHSIFVGQSLWSQFKLYLGASHCILPFQLLPHLFCSVGIFMLRGVYFYLYFSCFNCLLIYVYELFIDICLYCVLFKIKILFYLLVFSTHAVMHFV